MAQIKKVLITGCSTGIGRSAAQLFAERGWDVYALVRNIETAKDLVKKSITLLCADVTDARAIEDIFRKYAPFDVVVNNAGFGQMGPLEDVSEEELRYQFEVNVFAVHRIIRLALPYMRNKRSGCIVNVGSVVGHLTFPLAGAYCASKHALRSLTDALRIEVKSFGIRVVLIEPGPIQTSFGKTVVEKFAPDRSGAYCVWRKAVIKLIQKHRSQGASPQRVAKVILRCCESKIPFSRIVLTKRGWLMLMLRRLLPDVLWDRIFTTAAKLLSP